MIGRRRAAVSLGLAPQFARRAPETGRRPCEAARHVLPGLSGAVIHRHRQPAGNPGGGGTIGPRVGPAPRKRRAAFQAAEQRNYTCNINYLWVAAGREFEASACLGMHCRESSIFLMNSCRTGAHRRPEEQCFGVGVFDPCVHHCFQKDHLRPYLAPRRAMKVSWSSVPRQARRPGRRTNPAPSRPRTRRNGALVRSRRAPPRTLRDRLPPNAPV